jgi:23S rRNA pseudouridine2605 synthase
MTEPESDVPDQHADASALGTQERLQKIIAAAGIASRRKAEELILAGRVQVNGQTVTELGTKADPSRDHIRVDGKLLHGPERHRYVALNKPKGYVTTASDPEGRPTVMDLVSGGARLFPVGRLDYSSEGLLLMTNDGELANALTRAAAHVEKTYLVKVSGKPSDSALNQLRHGVMIDRGSQIRDTRRTSRDKAGSRDGSGKSGRPEHDPQPRHNEGRVMTAPARIRLLREGENPWYEMILIEGRNREIRKMFEEVGYHVEKIRRVGYGPLVLDLEPGRSRELTLEEVAALRRAAEGKPSKHAPEVRLPRPGRPARRLSDRTTSASGRKPGDGRPASGEGRKSGDRRPKAVAGRGERRPTGARGRKPDGRSSRPGRSNAGRGRPR